VGSLVLLAVVLAGWATSAAATTGVARLCPTVGFLDAILLVAHLVDVEGVFAWLADLGQAGRADQLHQLGHRPHGCRSDEMSGRAAAVRLPGHARQLANPAGQAPSTRWPQLPRSCSDPTPDSSLEPTCAWTGASSPPSAADRSRSSTADADQDCGPAAGESRCRANPKATDALSPSNRACTNQDRRLPTICAETPSCSATAMFDLPLGAPLHDPLLDRQRLCRGAPPRPPLHLPGLVNTQFQNGFGRPVWPPQSRT